MSLTILLSSSSFFLPHYLEKQFVEKNISADMLNIATQLKLPVAYLHHLKSATYGSIKWQKYSQALAHHSNEQAFALARFYQSQQKLPQAIFWFKHSNRLGHKKAGISLAEMYISQEKYRLAEQLLLTLEPTLLIQELRVDIALTIGEVEHASTLLADNSLGKVNADFLAKLDRYSIFNEKLSELESNLASCKNSVQFFATNFDDLAYVEQLLTRFSTHSLASAFCFAPPKYVSLAKLNCSHTKDEAISCQESYWAEQAENIDSRYLAVLLPQGGANVHLGIMYLDRDDNEYVLAHELSHFLGFIDEYPLSKNHQACQSEQKEMFAHNVALLSPIYEGDLAAIRHQVLANIPWAKHIKPSTPIFQAQENGWQLGTPKEFENEVGVFTSPTCQFSEVNAFKPVQPRTFMQSFEAEIPSSYQKILQDLSGEFSMPSFHYNIALAKYQEEEENEARIWLKKAARNEKDNKRYQKVLLGQF